MAQFPDVYRAQRDEQERIGALWIDFLNEQAALDDRFAVADDALERWNNDYPVWLTDTTQAIFVAKHEGRIEGFATAHRWGPPPIYAESSEVYLDELYVTPAARRQTLGTQLVRAVHHWAASVGATRMRLQMMTANPKAQAFWSSLGATPFTTTMTMDVDAPAATPGEESSQQIGFH
jgi:GNAT superfamily N-acetyltransferase